MFVDSHCHPDLPPLAGREEDMLAAMREARVGHALAVSVNLERFPAILALAERQPHIFASVGVHPEETEVREAEVAELVRLAAHPRIVAIGETGLDYYWHKDAPEWQRARFRTHIHAARESHLPLIIHCRDALADTLAILREEGAQDIGGVYHCFTGDVAYAEEVLETLDFYISFSGIVTFKNAAALKEVARMVPENRLLIETDAPYLAPVPHRGKPNQPAWVIHVAEELARLRQTSVETIARASRENFFRLFARATPVAA
ncbi:MAG: TatD family hydrolase [Rhodocyclaceae bacterium]|nr:TatD family hydrolase [Rhodocyclaceae bacterium]